VPIIETPAHSVNLVQSELIAESLDSSEQQLLSHMRQANYFNQHSSSSTLIMIDGNAPDKSNPPPFHQSL
jgi:hypothetical protein